MSILLVQPQAGIASCFKKQLFSKLVYKFIKGEFFRKKFSRAMDKSAILQLYRATIFLAHLLMCAFNNLFNKCVQKIRQMKNQ